MFILKSLSSIIALITLPILFANRISPAYFYPAGWATYLILPLLIINLLFLILWIFKRKIFSALFSLLPIFIGYGYLLRTFSLHPNAKEKGEISVLSYNVRVFNVYAHLSKDKPEIARRMIEWINSDESDVKCFQDFYNDNTSKLHNTLKKLSLNGKYKYYFTKTTKNRLGASFGVAIFSKFPIIKVGNIYFEKSFNKGVYVDLKIRNETIRVINIHLESMSIDENAIFSADNEKGSFKYLQKVLRNGMAKRAHQMEEVEKVLHNCPHKIILCGDLNDMPYSYSYQRLSNNLKNSFETAGNGFGFTFNGKLFFLRIDNQFYDKRIKIKTFETLRNIRFSDHFPLKATYDLGGN